MPWPLRLVATDFGWRVGCGPVVSKLTSFTRRASPSHVSIGGRRPTGADIRSRQDLVADKVAQDLRNPDFADFLVIHHVHAIKFRTCWNWLQSARRVRSCPPPRSPATVGREKKLPIESAGGTIRWDSYIRCRHGPKLPLAPLASAPLPFQKRAPLDNIRSAPHRTAHMRFFFVPGR